MAAKTTLKDNSTRSQKVMLRHTALQLLGDETPVILETHGGWGDLWSALYSHVEDGLVFETDPDKAIRLAEQRPTWSVYQADCEISLKGGAGSHLTFNFMDVDPYGSPWEAIQAYFASDRPFAGRMVLVVNDGLRKRAGMTAWHIDILQPWIEKYGNHNMFRAYPQVVPELLGGLVAAAGYEVRHFDYTVTGWNAQMLHYLAVLERTASD